MLLNDARAVFFWTLTFFRDLRKLAQKKLLVWTASVSMATKIFYCNSNDCVIGEMDSNGNQCQPVSPIGKAIYIQSFSHPLLKDKYYRRKSEKNNLPRFRLLGKRGLSFRAAGGKGGRHKNMTITLKTWRFRKRERAG